MAKIRQDVAKPRNLQCRHCTWTTPPWITKANGQKRSGMDRLRDHVENMHPGEHEDLIDEMLRHDQRRDVRTIDG